MVQRLQPQSSRELPISSSRWATNGLKNMHAALFFVSRRGGSLPRRGLMLSTATATVALRSPRWQVSIGPQYHHDHSTGDPCALAQGRFPAVLAVEVPVRWRPAANRRGAACADPTHER